MKHKYILTFIIIAVLMGGYYLYSTMQKNQNFNSASPSPTIEEMNDYYTFTNVESGETISVIFNNTNNTAILNSADYQDLVFTQTISASGARYENTKEGLILWNKGDDISLMMGEEMLFTGTTKGGS